MKRIKKPIHKKEYQTLINFIGSNPSMRQNTKDNYLRLFTLLYYTGMRINEVSTLTIQEVKEGIKNKALIIKAHKQNKEREIILTPKAIKELTPLFLDEGDGRYKVIQPRGDKTGSVSTAGFTIEANKTIKSVLGDRYTSHSFRSGLITELGMNSVNPKVIQSFIGHKNVTTTMNYINPSENDIRGALLR